VSGRAGAPVFGASPFRLGLVEDRTWSVHGLHEDPHDHRRQEAPREYGATAGQVQALDRATTARHRRLERSKRLTTVTATELRKLVDEVR
jgi:hypothetical protein